MSEEVPSHPDEAKHKSPEQGSAMSRFYVTPGSVKGDKIYVGREESHHIIDVMRLGEGDKVTAFDGAGREYKGAISSVEGKRVIIDIEDVKASQRKPQLSISLAQAIPKKDKMDLIVQKATELGADEIMPVESARTVVRAKGERKRHKIDRWQKIAIESSKQCGRQELPVIKDIVRFDAALDHIPKYDLTIMPALSDEAVPLRSVLSEIEDRPSRILVIIGPEGGFSKNEIAAASEKGAVPVSLGALTLRSDTAAIATLAILNHELR